jgi:hypothetical protein
VTCEGLFLPRIATWKKKNPLNNIYTLMSGVVVVVVMRACKDSTSILHEAICQSRTPLWATRDGGRGARWVVLQGWGDDTCE